MPQKSKLAIHSRSRYANRVVHESRHERDVGLDIRVVSLLLIGNVRAAEQTLMGMISDSLCGVSHKAMATKMTDRECTQACTAKGAQYVLVSDGKVYKLTNHNADLKTHAGHTVNLTGSIPTHDGSAGLNGERVS